MKKQQVIEELKKIVGESSCLILTEDIYFYSQDKSHAEFEEALAVIFPSSETEVVELVKFANKNNIALVPSGGRTGLSGAAVATNNSVIVSFEKYNKIIALNELQNLLSVEAGVTTAQVQNYALENNLFYPVEFASSGSSQIGGNIATNAGGINVLRYGMTRQQVLSLKVITGKGDVMSFNKSLEKNNSGYDLMQLFIGSEGTLGFILEAEVRLQKKPLLSTVVFIGANSLVDVLEIFQALKAKYDFFAFEFFSKKSLSFVTDKHKQLRPEFNTDAEMYFLMEIETDNDEHFHSLLEKISKSINAEILIAHNEQQKKSLWQYRELISDSISGFKPYKYDISVPLASSVSFIENIELTLKERFPQAVQVIFGHLGDGNIHLNIVFPIDIQSDNLRLDVDQVVYLNVKNVDGSISAEHGIGLLKKSALSYTRSETELSLMKAIKHLFDPNNIMNPGKIFE